MGSTTTLAGGAWTISSLTLEACDTINVIAVRNATNLCPSLSSTEAIVSGETTSTPSITGTYCTATTITSVSGSSIAGEGTLIQIFENGVAEGTVDTVGSNGSWTADIGISISPGSTITATAIGGTSCGSVSLVSDGVMVETQTTNAITISGTLTEGDVSVSGTGINGDSVRIYIDETRIGGLGFVSGGTWTIAGLAGSDLYAGGSVTATTTTGVQCESAESAAKIVQCVLPLASTSITPNSETICAGQTVTTKIISSQNGVIYQFYDGATASGGGVLGNGGDIFITSGAISASVVLDIEAIKLSPSGCTNTLTTTFSATIIPLSNCDQDGDGILDDLDLDSDNDGIPNTSEDSGTGYSPTADADNDGILNYIDSDGWSHCCIADPGFPAFVDANADGINDTFDIDLDGLPDFRDLDADNDGLYDIREGDISIPSPDKDAGSDGVIDGFTDANLDGLDDAIAATPLSIPDTDGDGLEDFFDINSDGDAELDYVEGFDDDTTGNAANDYIARGTTFGGVYVFVDGDSDGLPNYMEDDDGDGRVNMFDADNVAYYRDSDNDGIIDLFDINSGGADALKPFPNFDHSMDVIPDFRDNTSAITLPITLLSFKSRCNILNERRVSWETVSEINNDFFTIEGSQDANLFLTIVTIEGAGNSNAYEAYEYYIPRKYNGLKYLRLKQTDFNGEFSYTDIILSKCDSVVLIKDFDLYPNPSYNGNTVLHFNNETHLENVKIRITNILGKTIYSENGLAKNGSVKLSLTFLPKGIYQVRLQFDSFFLTKKLIIQ